jgi:hypothetical protein
MSSLLLSFMIATCILVMMDRAVGTRTMALTVVFISSVYMLVFYYWRAMVKSSHLAEWRFNMRVAWCASLILVIFLGRMIQQYTTRSLADCVWVVVGNFQLVVLILIEILQPLITAETLCVAITV